VRGGRWRRWLTPESILFFFPYPSPVYPPVCVPQLGVSPEVGQPDYRRQSRVCLGPTSHGGKLSGGVRNGQEDKWPGSDGWVLLGVHRGWGPWWPDRGDHRQGGRVPGAALALGSTWCSTCRWGLGGPPAGLEVLHGVRAPCRWPEAIHGLPGSSTCCSSRIVGSNSWLWGHGAQAARTSCTKMSGIGVRTVLEYEKGGRLGAQPSLSPTLVPPPQSTLLFHSVPSPASHTVPSRIPHFASAIRSCLPQLLWPWWVPLASGLLYYTHMCALLNVLPNPEAV